LYGVARKAALEAFAASRRRKETLVDRVPDSPAITAPAADTDSLAMLDEEIANLSEAYRSAVVLCELDGVSRADAARQLGIAEGTLSSRLAAARKQLATRLRARGVMLSGSLFAALIASTATAVPPATAGVLSVKVAAITEGVSKAMLMSKLKTATAALLIVAAVGGAIVLNLRTQAGERPAQKKTEDGNDQKPKTDKERLQGKWQLVSQVRNGEEAKLKGDEAVVIEMSFVGDTMRLRNVTTHNLDPANPQLSTTYARYRLETTAKLKSFDEVECSVEDLFDLAEIDKKFDNPDERYLGVYSLEDDTLTLCFSMIKGTKMRPTAFESKEGSDVMLQVFKRAAGQAR
jgi:uncharacterized protein (TIGR03067 family)